MARTADKDLPRRRLKSGERLKEVMELRGYGPKQFLSIMKSTYGEKSTISDDGYYLQGLDTLPTLSRIRSGSKTLQRKHAIMAAEILDIDVNYLLGTVDDFQSASYEEYTIAYLKHEQLRRDLKRYKYLVKRFYNEIIPKGEWIKKGDELECSICGDYWGTDKTWTAQAIKKHFRYCPYCGARMESEE